MESLYNNIQPALRKQLYLKAAKQLVPINGAFELTPRCNFNCRMCYIRMSEDELQKIGRERTAEEWIEMGRICKEQGMLFLLLTGGEPFLRPDFKQIYTELNKMGFIIYINSNGAMIDEEMVEWLKEYPPSKINITLYGGSNETYETLCRIPKGFDKVTHAIDLLKEAGICVGINASFTPYNIKDMDAIYDFAKKRNIKVKTTVYMFPPVRRAEGNILEDNMRFTPKEAGEAFYRSKKCEMNDSQFELFLSNMKKGHSVNIDGDECERIPDEHMGCIAGRCSFWISWDGKMTPCGLMNEPVARPFEEGFINSWNTICEETHKILLPSECSNCKNRHACTVCGALVKAESNGDSTKKPEYLCGLTEQYVRLCIGDK